MLEDINFSCLAGETIGIIGSTGAGKTTLVNLIMRFFQPTAGAIKINGINIDSYNIVDLRQRIALVPQEPLLFTGTIAENIRWGKESASLKEIIAAAKVAQAHSFIQQTSDQYATILGQAGVNLSGGQKQRIAIARALVRKPDLLILDDSTSAVDMATESKIRAGLKTYTKGLTNIIIAQRLTSIIRAHRIVVLDQGRLVGIGNHEKLIQTCSVYQDIYDSQIGNRGVG